MPPAFTSRKKSQAAKAAHAKKQQDLLDKQNLEDSLREAAAAAQAQLEGGCKGAHPVRQSGRNPAGCAGEAGAPAEDLAITKAKRKTQQAAVEDFPDEQSEDSDVDVPAQASNTLPDKVVSTQAPADKQRSGEPEESPVLEGTGSPPLLATGKAHTLISPSTNPHAALRDSP
eukprot:3312483-Rhodomonas_salina.1